MIVGVDRKDGEVEMGYIDCKRAGFGTVSYTETKDGHAS